MAKGDTYPSEASEYTGDRARKPTRRLTDNGAHNRHLYLSAPTFADGGAALIYVSERTGAQNFYRMDLSTSESTQLTDAEGIFAGGAWYLERTREIFFWRETALAAVNIDTLDERAVYDEGYQGGYLSASSDGRFVAFAAKCEDVPGLDGDFEGHHALMVVSADGDGAHPALVVPFPVSHVQFSPADPEKIIFCWEGAWRSVPQRIWWSDPEGLEAGPLGSQNPNEERAHEFFSPTGNYVGYHGTRFHIRRGEEGYFLEDTAWFVGLLSSDGSADRQVECPGPTGHCQINHAEDTFVCDRGGGMDRERESVALIRPYEDKGVFEPLFYHGSSWKTQGAHPHPQFRPGDEEVVFTTDFSGRSNIYLTEVE